MKRVLSVFVSALLLSFIVNGGLSYMKPAINPSNHEILPLDLPDQH